jgi:predicted peptidase
MLLRLVVCAFLLPTALRAQTGFLDRSLTVRGETFRYQLHVPDDYDSQRAWPIIVSLHGNGAQGSDGRKQTASGLADHIRQHSSRFPAIVLFPQAKVGTRWFDADMEELVIAELDQTISAFHVDARRIYLTGFSMGATGAYRIAARWPDRFAALAVVAGRVEPGSRYSAAEIESDRRTNPFVAASDPFAALALRIGKHPIWILHGDADEGVPVEQSRRLVGALKKERAAIRYTEYPEVDHVGAAQRAFDDVEMLEWLFRQHR